MKKLAFILGLAVLTGGIAAYAASPFQLAWPISWHVADDIDSLQRAVTTQGTRELLQVNALPRPLQRYFAIAVQSGRTLPLAMETNVRGMLTLPGFNKAMPAAGREILLAQPGGMVWDVTISFNPLVTARVSDRYLHERGSIYTNFFSVLNFINDRDIPALNKTQALRWLGLGVMLPSIFLNPALKWEELDERRVRASLMINGEMISQDFLFDDEGLIAMAKSADRYERYGDQYKRTGSIMHRYAYKRVDGIAVPTHFSIIRIEPDGQETEFWVGEYSNIVFHSAYSRQAASQSRKAALTSAGFSMVER